MPGGSREWAEINDHPVASATDRIRLIAIEMEGVFGNEGALPFCPLNAAIVPRATPQNFCRVSYHMKVIPMLLSACTGAVLPLIGGCAAQTSGPTNAVGKTSASSRSAAATVPVSEILEVPRLPPGTLKTNL